MHVTIQFFKIRICTMAFAPSSLAGIKQIHVMQLILPFIFGMRCLFRTNFLQLSWAGYNSSSVQMVYDILYKAYIVN